MVQGNDSLEVYSETQLDSVDASSSCDDHVDANANADRPDTESRLLCSGRPLGRPPRYREQGSLIWSADWPTGPVSAKRAQGCARQSTATVDWPLVRSTVAVDRPGLSATVWVRNWVKNNL